LLKIDFDFLFIHFLILIISFFKKKQKQNRKITQEGTKGTKSYFIDPQEESKIPIRTMKKNMKKDINKLISHVYLVKLNFFSLK